MQSIKERILEGLPPEKQTDFEANCAPARPYADLNVVTWKFLYWLLTDEEINPGITHPVVKNEINNCGELLLLVMREVQVNKYKALTLKNSLNTAIWGARKWDLQIDQCWCTVRAAESAMNAVLWSASCQCSSDWAARQAVEWVASNDTSKYERMSNKLIELVKAA